MSCPASSTLDAFVAFSAELTGFGTFELIGTGQAASYRDTVVRVVGEPFLIDLLDTYRDQVTGIDIEQDRAARLDQVVLGDPRFGPPARNVIKLWYSGVWFELPQEWADLHALPGANATFTPSPNSYPEGLLWYAIGANPPGARAPGYGSWAQPPRIPTVPSTAVPRPILT